MKSAQIFSEWSTPLIADACVRLKVPLRIAAEGLRPVVEGMRVCGPVRPVRHYGSVDVFLEAVAASKPGEVLVIDNGGRTDEGCIGGLTVLEAKAGDMAGVVLWGLHRDTAELRRIGFPVFSHGTNPTGPMRLDAREPEVFSSARFGNLMVTAGDFVFADDDGAVFVAREQLAEIVRVAQGIGETERAQAQLVRAGRLLREQLRLAEFVAARNADPTMTFRRHLRGMRGAIEE